MKTKLYDNRQSLWDLGLRHISIGRSEFEILEEPMRGGTCLVYKAEKIEHIGIKALKHKVLLKEFYPLLNSGNKDEISRNEDGSFDIPESITASHSYQQRLQRFLDSYELMVELSRMDESMDHAVTVHSLTEQGNTWYIEEAYDSGILFFDHLGVTSISEFLKTIDYCLKTIGDLHNLGYYHLDLKPNNLSFTRSGILRFFDTDSIVKGTDLGTYTDFPESGGFSAPELSQAIARPYDACYLIGPWTDIYSIAQFICYYLFKKPITYYELLNLLPELENHILFTDYYENENWISPHHEVSMKDGIFYINYSSDLMEEEENLICHPLVPRNGLFLLKLFLLKALHPDISRRYQNVSEAREALWDIIDKFSNFKPSLRDYFQETIPETLGYEKELELLEQSLFGNVKSVEIKKKDFFGESIENLKIPELRAAQIESPIIEFGEELAKYYATLNRERYDSIHEIRGTDLKDALLDLRFFESNVSSLEDELAMATSHQKLPTLIIFYDESSKTAPVDDGAYLNDLYDQNLDHLHMIFVNSTGRMKYFKKRGTRFQKSCIPTVTLIDTYSNHKHGVFDKLFQYDWFLDCYTAIHVFGHVYLWKLISLGLIFAGLFNRKLAVPVAMFLIRHFPLRYWQIEYILSILIGGLCFTLFLHGHIFRWAKLSGITTIGQYLKKFAVWLILSLPIFTIICCGFSDVTVWHLIGGIICWIYLDYLDYEFYYYGTSYI